MTDTAFYGYIGSSLKSFNHPTDCHGKREIAQVSASSSGTMLFLIIQFANLATCSSQ